MRALQRVIAVTNAEICVACTARAEVAVRRSFIFAIGLLMASLPAWAQPTADELTRRSIERRAIEAVIWGMPAVNYDLMYQAMVRETKGAFNQIVYWSRLPDWKNQTLTPIPTRSI